MIAGFWAPDPDKTLPCAAQWEVAKNGYPWKVLMLVDPETQVKAKFMDQCCQLKATALVNVYGPDVVAQFKAACVASNGTLNDATQFAGGVAGGAEGLFSYLGIDFGGATGRLDANKANITKAVVAIVVVLLAVFFIYKTYSK